MYISTSTDIHKIKFDLISLFYDILWQLENKSKQQLSITFNEPQNIFGGYNYAFLMRIVISYYRGRSRTS